MDDITTVLQQNTLRCMDRLWINTW